MPASDEGVIKFTADHRREPLAGGGLDETARALGGWRSVLLRTGLVGRDPARYGGAGFGNLSARVSRDSEARTGERAFLITGSQTGHRDRLRLADYCLVERYDAASNRVASTGIVLPSSESMTHGAFYDLADEVRAVFHGHAPALWQGAEALGLPVSDREIAYGTPAMAREVARLYAQTNLAAVGVLVMGGHEDGVISFGSDVREAGVRLIAALARACE